MSTITETLEAEIEEEKDKQQRFEKAKAAFIAAHNRIPDVKEENTIWDAVYNPELESQGDQ